LDEYPENRSLKTSKGTKQIGKITAGIDVSKDTLDACRLLDGTCLSLANTRADHKAQIALAGPAVPRIGSQSRYLNAPHAF